MMTTPEFDEKNRPANKWMHKKQNGNHLLLICFTHISNQRVRESGGHTPCHRAREAAGIRCVVGSVGVEIDDAAGDGHVGHQDHCCRGGARALTIPLPLSDGVLNVGLEASAARQRHVGSCVGGVGNGPQRGQNREGWTTDIDDKSFRDRSRSTSIRLRKSKTYQSINTCKNRNREKSTKKGFKFLE